MYHDAMHAMSTLLTGLEPKTLTRCGAQRMMACFTTLCTDAARPQGPWVHSHSLLLQPAALYCPGIDQAETFGGIKIVTREW